MKGGIIITKGLGRGTEANSDHAQNKILSGPEKALINQTMCKPEKARINQNMCKIEMVLTNQTVTNKMKTS